MASFLENLGTCGECGNPLSAVGVAVTACCNFVCTGCKHAYATSAAAYYYIKLKNGNHAEAEICGRFLIAQWNIVNAVYSGVPVSDTMHAELANSKAAWKKVDPVAVLASSDM